MKAATGIFEKYGDFILSVIRSQTGNATLADDLFQDTWVRAMRAIGRFSPDRRFPPWLFSVCVNRYRDQYRKRRRWLQRLVSYSSRSCPDMAVSRVPSVDPMPDDALQHREIVATVRRAVGSLDDPHRLPVILHYFQQLSIAEVAEILDIPAGTVKTRLAAARRKLMPLVEGIEHE